MQNNKVVPQQVLDQLKLQRETYVLSLKNAQSFMQKGTWSYGYIDAEINAMEEMHDFLGEAQAETERAS